MDRQNYNYIVIASGLLAYNVVHHVDVCHLQKKNKILTYRLLLMLFGVLPNNTCKIVC